MIARVLILATALAAASSAFAQTAPKSTDAARALIEESGVTDLFEPVEDERIKVRHTASGLVCRFYDPEARNGVHVFTGLPRGEDVGCVSDGDGLAITLYATRYAPPGTARGALSDAEAAIRHRFADARPIEAFAVISVDGMPAPLVRHFLVTVREEQWLTSAIVAQHGDWTIKLRYSQRALDDAAVRAAQLQAGAIFSLAQTDMPN